MKVKSINRPTRMSIKLSHALVFGWLKEKGTFPESIKIKGEDCPIKWSKFNPNHIPQEKKTLQDKNISTKIVRKEKPSKPHNPILTKSKPRTKYQ
jgi:hypothetical protein